MDVQDDGDLQAFLSDWRREISRRRKKDDGSVLGKRSDAVGLEDAPQKKREAPEPSEATPLLVLAEPKPNQGVSLGVDHVVSSGGDEDTTSQNLVAKLIADLDEINTVPFFDVQLPREVALLIFAHLNMADLCTCARVSRSWRCLADDNVLWCRICHLMGYETDMSVHGHVSWKMVVMEIVQRRRRVERNWKERVCGLSDHQPDNVGVLCCVDYCSQQILACYTSGEVYSWDLEDSDGPVRMRQRHTRVQPSCCCALSHGWAAVGSVQGDVRLFDTDTHSEVYSLSDLGCVNSVCVAAGQGAMAVGVASYTSHFPEEVTSSVVTVLVMGGVGGWEKSHLSLPRDNKVTRVSLVPRESPACPYAVLYSTRTTLTLQIPSTPLSQATHILTSAGETGATCVNCFDFNSDTVACGTSAYGYRVQLYDLSSGVHKTSLCGHGQEVLCVNIASSPPGWLVSGSADKRVRVFDCRCPQPALTLRGHSGPVLSVQMDQWKVISGSQDGTMIVWDRRMAGELWRSHDRHPVELCRFEGSHLMEAHVPMNKQPVIDGSSPNLCHRRQQGLIRVFDFSVDPLYYTRMLPSICSSAYDEPSASFYNLDLRVPYDTII